MSVELRRELRAQRGQVPRLPEEEMARQTVLLLMSEDERTLHFRRRDLRQDQKPLCNAN